MLVRQPSFVMWVLFLSMVILAWSRRRFWVEMRLLEEREEELPLDDRLAKKLGQLKAAKAKVEEIAKDCDDHLAAFRRQQEECLA